MPVSRQSQFAVGIPKAKFLEFRCLTQAIVGKTGFQSADFVGLSLPAKSFRLEPDLRGGRGEVAQVATEFDTEQGPLIEKLVFLQFLENPLQQLLRSRHSLERFIFLFGVLPVAFPELAQERSLQFDIEFSQLCLDPGDFNHTLRHHDPSGDILDP